MRQGVQWDWTLEIEEAFKSTKQAVAEAQTLRVVDPAPPFLLIVQVDETEFVWGLWQKHGSWKVLIGFWSQLWKASEVQHSLINNWLPYVALLSSDAITGRNPVPCGGVAVILGKTL